MQSNKIPKWQGDLVLVPIKEIPNTAKPIESKTLVYGEQTGHSHKLRGNATILQMGEQTFVRVEEQTELIHEDHRPRVLEPGNYELRREEEYEPYTEAFRTVSD